MVDIDQIFNLLSNERRRYALYYLEEQNEPVHIAELAEKVAEWQSSGSKSGERRFEDVRIELLHTDLPKTDELEYVTYDRDEKVVTLSGSPPAFDTIISIAKIIERPRGNSE